MRMVLAAALLTACGASDDGAGTGARAPTGVAGAVPGAAGASGGAAGGTTSGLPAAGSGSVVGVPGGAATPLAPVGGMGGATVSAGSGAISVGGAGGAAGVAGSAGMGGGGMEPIAPTASMPCLQSASEVLLIGDSYVSYINPLVPPLEARATADGQLAAGQHYNNLAVAGTFIAQVESQWQSGRAGSTYVVMDGGGNDILIGAPQCLAAGSDMVKACTDVVDGAVVVGERMYEDMKASGIAGVVYFFYPHIPAGGDDILDYALPLIQQKCQAANTATFKCTFVDTRAAFMGHPEHFFLDGIHPSASGAALLAELVWAAMKDSCIGQSSGCCM